MGFVLFFFFNDTATTEIYTLSLHAALPICPVRLAHALDEPDPRASYRRRPGTARPPPGGVDARARPRAALLLRRRLANGRRRADPESTRLNSRHSQSTEPVFCLRRRGNSWALFFFFFLMIRPPPRSTLFPYTPLSRSAPFGLHTHWTSPTHARPTGGDPARRVRREAEWMRAHGLEPRFFCGGGWYTDDAVRDTVRALGLVDCTERGGAPAAGVLPTTHSLGKLARAVLRPLPDYVHAYFHDYDLLDPMRRRVLSASPRLLGARRSPLDPLAVSATFEPRRRVAAA